jgi:hydrogenase maturation factor
MREVLPGDVVPITPKRDAVIVEYIDGRRHVSIECVDSEKLPALEREAQRIMYS